MGHGLHENLFFFENTRIWTENPLNVGEDLFFFWRSLEFGQKHPLNFGKTFFCGDQLKSVSRSFRLLLASKIAIPQSKCLAALLFWIIQTLRIRMSITSYLKHTLAVGESFKYDAIDILVYNFI